MTLLSNNFDFKLRNMTLSNEQLLEIIEKYQPIIRYTIGEDTSHILFHLQNDKEISVSIKPIDERFEVLGQHRNKNQRGFGEATSIIKGDTELGTVKEILDNLLGYNLKKENK